MARPRKLNGIEVGTTAELNEEQTEAYQKILDNEIVALYGKAGSGKTFTACYAAGCLLENKKVNKIYITRPNVVTEKFGFLPGDLNEKFDPFMEVIRHNFKNSFGIQKARTWEQDRFIEIATIAHMRGRNIDDVLIVDEAQNLTIHQLKMILTRIGKTGKIILTGDTDQIDIRDSGFSFLKNLEHIKGFDYQELKVNHRSEIVNQILEVFKEFKL